MRVVSSLPSEFHISFRQKHIMLHTTNNLNKKWWVMIDIINKLVNAFKKWICLVNKVHDKTKYKISILLI